MADRSITATLKGGAALKGYLKRISASLGPGAHVNVGFLASATYTVDPESGKEALPVAQVAFWNEFGTSRTPPRPFMRMTVASKSPRWGIGLGAALRRTDYDAEMALAILGEEIQGQIVHTIQEFQDPPNAPYTVQKKGFNKPLIDTGRMQREVDYQVLHGLDDSE